MAFSGAWGNSTPAATQDITIAPNEGDLLLCYACDDVNGTMFENYTFTGWTELTLSSLNSTNDNQAFHVWYKIAGASETSANLDIDVGINFIAGVVAFSGIDTADPFDVTTVESESGASASTTTDISITPETNGCDIVFLEGRDTSTSTSFTFSTTSGTTGSWTTRNDQHGGTYYHLGAGSCVQTTASALTARSTAANGGHGAVLIALKPSGGGGGAEIPVIASSTYSRMRKE